MNEIKNVRIEYMDIRMNRFRESKKSLNRPMISDGYLFYGSSYRGMYKYYPELKDVSSAEVIAVEGDRVFYQENNQYEGKLPLNKNPIGHFKTDSPKEVSLFGAVRFGEDENIYLFDSVKKIWKYYAMLEDEYHVYEGNFSLTFYSVVNELFLSFTYRKKVPYKEYDRPFLSLPVVKE